MEIILGVLSFGALVSFLAAMALEAIGRRSQRKSPPTQHYCENRSETQQNKPFTCNTRKF